MPLVAARAAVDGRNQAGNERETAGAVAGYLVITLVAELEGLAGASSPSTRCDATFSEASDLETALAT